MEEYRRIKLNDGGCIPTIAFGTGTSYFNRVDDVCEGLVKAVKTGYRWIDTAVMYGTEVGVGKGLVKVFEEGLCKREELFITTKITPNTWRFQEVVDTVNKSLENLQLEYIDLVMIHFPGLPKGFQAEEKPERFINIPREEKEIAEARMQMWEAFQECQKQGKIKHLGVSNFTRHHIEGLINNPRCKVTPCVNEFEFNPYINDEDMLKVCKENNIVVQAYGPVGSGTINTFVGGAQEGVATHVLQDPVIKTIASRIECTPAQVCIAFALAKGLAVVTKTEKETRMKENLESIEVAKKLTAEDIQIIDTLNKNLRKFWDVYAIP